MFLSGFDFVIVSRMFSSVVFGFALGLEREITNKHAGLRTHILVCLGSAVFTLLSIYAFPLAVDQAHPQAFGDPARIAAQILTGIGFIGGGTVLRHGSSVYGLTTAATLWVAAAIGMACGAGMFKIAFVLTLLSVGVLVLIRSFEKNVLVSSTKNVVKLKISITCNNENSSNIHNYIMEKFDYIHEINKEVKKDDNNMVLITAKVDAKNKNQIQSLYRKFQNLDGVKSILMQENDE